MFDDIVYELKLILQELMGRVHEFWATSKRKIITITLLSFFILVGIYIGTSHFFKAAPGGDIRLNIRVARLTHDEVRSLKRYLNPYHVLVGRTKGLATPFASQETFEANEWSNIHSNDLEEVEDCDNYEVAKSTYSIPYLKADAKEFLDEVGELFAQRLNELGVGHYRFKVNSLLRTLRDQKNLQGTNPNAAKTTSSHLYGRSFDIAESKFYDGDSKDPKYSAQLRLIILRELIKMQQQGRCYVILENVTNCIHVTVR